MSLGLPKNPTPPLTEENAFICPIRKLETTRARAFGKTIVVGEHAVVYGSKAIAMPVFSVDMRVELRAIRDQSVKVHSNTVRMTLGGQCVTEDLKGVVEDAFEYLNIPPFSLEIDGASSVLVGAGLGSSASLCVVVLKAIAQAAGKALSKEELSMLANKLERRFHGNPSGLDTAVVAWEEVISFSKGSDPVAIPVKNPPAGRWRFAVLDCGVRSSTLAMVKHAAPYFTSRGGEHRVEHFNQLADQAATALRQGDLTMLASTMEEAGALLDEAGIVNSPLRSTIQTARAAGAIAAKVTGAGGGGCVLALLDPEEAPSSILRLKSQLGHHRVFEVELV